MKRALALLLPNLFAASLCAQVGQFPGTSVPLASTWQQSIAVPAGNTPTLLNFAVDAPPAGQDTIDVLVVDPNVVISLILPAGTEINASNATANGFVFSTNTIAGVGADLTPFSIGGIHTIIQLPIPAQTGVYSVKADATNATADTAMVVWYYPSSTVALGAATDAPTYRQGDLVILIRHKCASTDPLAANLTSTGWNTVFAGNANDGVVPLLSQLNGGSSGQVTGLIHSAGLTRLSFSGPSELDPNTTNAIQTLLIQLLNASVGSFVNLP